MDTWIWFYLFSVSMLNLKIKLSGKLIFYKKNINGFMGALLIFLYNFDQSKRKQIRFFEILFHIKKQNMLVDWISCEVVKPVILTTSDRKRVSIPFLFLSGIKKYFRNYDLKTWRYLIIMCCMSLKKFFSIILKKQKQ